MTLAAGSALRLHTQAVKARAAELGFDAVGIAEAGPIDPDDRLGGWLAQGYHAGMTWMEHTKSVRQDVRAKLPGARSVVVVARNYHAPRPPGQPGAGRVSRYAWGRDYHRALAKPLRALAQLLDAFDPKSRSYCSIDTGPVAERAWAQRAGVGWFGKNAMLIREGLGSWCFLGTIITKVVLESDTPVEERCGTCRRCIDACPTGAIIAPGLIDARRCIAYHTVENRGEIPADIRPHFGDWLFGCDTCQDVCPWNRRAPTTSLKDFRPRPGNASLDLEMLETMDEPAFNKRFEGSPIRRIGLSGIQRNASIVRCNAAAPPQ